jgi:NADH:ubiquinone oxidoreductase subunit F (NADH-binding)/NAD-dependent dihydropyrimidine dehydrogenase PreA subunit
LGEPRPKPPYPAVHGLWGEPTIVNNVKTLASVPAILHRGPDWYRSLGTEGNAGTVVFSLVGQIVNTGLVEVPLGMKLRELLEEVGGGGLDGKTIKAVQTGGPSGGCIPARLFDLPIDFESLTKAGSIMGSGGMVVMDDETCMVDVAKYFLAFTRAESCGKCTPCRDGIREMHNILSRITAGKAEPGDLDALSEIAAWVKDCSICGLGQTAPNPVLTTLRYFRDEYEDHILEKRCPAGICPALITLAIDPDRCTGCGLCRRECPADAVSGEKNSPHVIDPDKCTRCRICADVCPEGAVEVVR